MFLRPDTKRTGPRANEDRPASSTLASAITDTNLTPRTPGRLVLRSRGRGWSLIVDQCPFCSAPHHHGAPRGPETEETSRLSQCHLVKRRTYRIVVERPE